MTLQGRRLPDSSMHPSASAGSCKAWRIPPQSDLELELAKRRNEQLRNPPRSRNRTYSQPGTLKHIGRIYASLLPDSLLIYAGNHSLCCWAQGLTKDGFVAHPAALDASTHFGALHDTDAYNHGGLSSPARVPVALAALALARSAQVCRESPLC